jgi:ATP-binding cassette, subfamily F, member 3
MSNTAVLDACTEILPGLDSDIFEYIVGLLEDYAPGENDDDTMRSTIAEFLVESEYCSAATDAETKASRLLQRLELPSSKPSNGGVPSNIDVAVHQTAKMTLEPPRAAVPRPPVATAIASASTTAKEPLPQQTTNVAKPSKGSTGREGRKSKTSKKKMTEAELAAAQALEIEAELHAARVAAVKARTKHGAYKGSLDATSFTLPNPGGGIPLLEDASCTLVWGRIYGLIGRNGTGKSTMLRALASRRVGNVPENVTVHYVSQEVNLTETLSRQRPVECVVAADVERSLLLDELAVIEEQASAGSLDEDGSKRHAQVLSRLDEIQSDSAERRARDLLTHLGFTDELASRSLQQLSGGWRVRTMLAAAIFAQPDVLLLDEPTNHLSILAVLWLARELSTSPTWKSRIVVVVSHDRHFMDQVCTDCLHISGAAKRLTQSRGNYSQWATQRREQQVLFAKQQAGRQEEIDKLREYAGHGFKYGGSASQINKMGMKAKQADKLQEIQEGHAQELAALEEDLELPMKIESGGELDGFVVQLLNVGFGYPHSSPARLFEHCEFGITSQSRIVLLGENGTDCHCYCFTFAGLNSSNVGAFLARFQETEKRLWSSSSWVNSNLVRAKYGDLPMLVSPRWTSIMPIRLTCP